MIIFPKEIFEGAFSGLKLWLENVVPSLLPFMITTNCLMASNLPKLLGKALQPVSKALFNLTGEECFVFIVGLTAGYPMGIKTAAELYRSGSVSKETAHRLMLYCNNPGILFILGTVGTVFFKCSKIGYFLLMCNLLSSFSLAVMSGLFSMPQKNLPTDKITISFSQKDLANAIFNAISSILTIGGYIIIFSVLNVVFKTVHIYDGITAILHPIIDDNTVCRAVSLGMIEITNACSTLSFAQSKANILAAAALIGWGGLSVHAQSIEFLDGTDLDCRFYLFGKAINALLCLFFANIFFNIFF